MPLGSETRAVPLSRPRRPPVPAPAGPSKPGPTRLGLAGLPLLGGCSLVQATPPSPEGVFSLAAPPLETAHGAGAWWLLAGLGLGAAAWAWAAWWQRRSLARASRRPAGGTLPADLCRLRDALALLEDLLREWGGRGKGVGS